MKKKPVKNFDDHQAIAVRRSVLKTAMAVDMVAEALKLEGHEVADILRDALTRMKAEKEIRRYWREVWDFLFERDMCRDPDTVWEVLTDREKPEKEGSRVKPGKKAPK